MTVLICVLLAGAGVIWFQALKPAAAASAGCNPPGAAPTTQAQTSRSRTATTTYGGGPTTSRSTAASSSAARSTAIKTTLGTFTDKNTLASVRPADPSSFTVTVFNASAQRGMATTVSQELRSVGFARIGTPANDPLYPASDLRCVGEIRYGQAGVGSARTVLLLMPCAQLVVDNRVDESVDISIGARYEFTGTPEPVKAQLAAIKQAAVPPAVIEGVTASARSAAPTPPLPSVSCPD